MGPAGVYPSGMDSSTLDVGDVAPPFTLPDADGNPVSLSDFAGKPVIVYFYPAAMTPGCTTEACDFTSARGPLDGGGYAVLGISPDKPEKLAQVPGQGGPDDHPAVRRGPVGDDRLRRLRREEACTARPCRASSGRRSWSAPDGKIEQAWRNVKATGHVARVLKELGLAS